MLWYKALRESQTRFLLGMVALAGFCAGPVWFQRVWSTPAERIVYTRFIWKAIFGGYVSEVFVLVVLFLGGGGLWVERGRGCAGLTLALPVSRARHVGTRAAVGILEVLTLALVPAVVVTLLVYSLMTELPAIDRLHINLQDIMTGDEMEYLQATTGRLVSPLPWMTIAVMGFFALLFVGVGIGLTNRQEF